MALHKFITWGGLLMLLIAAQPVLAVDSEALGDELNKVKEKQTTPSTPANSSATPTKPKTDKAPTPSSSKTLTTLASAK